MFSLIMCSCINPLEMIGKITQLCFYCYHEMKTLCCICEAAFIFLGPSIYLLLYKQFQNRTQGGDIARFLRDLWL